MIIEGDLSPQEIFTKLGGIPAFLPDELTIEQDGKPVPMRELPDVKKVHDLPTLVKNYVEGQQEIGRRVRIPGKDAKPEDVTAFKGRLVEAGILTAPLGSPADYGIAKPEALPDGVAWNDEMATEFATVLHRHGAPKALAQDLLTIYWKALLGTQEGLKTSMEAGMAALKAEYGDKFDERLEVVKRFSPMIFKSPEEQEFFDRLGLGNHPGFLSIMMRLAPLAQQDSSFIAGLQRPVGATTADEARAEHARVMSDPKHEYHDAYMRGEKKAIEYVDSLYKRAFSGVTV